MGYAHFLSKRKFKPLMANNSTDININSLNKEKRLRRVTLEIQVTVCTLKSYDRFTNT